MSRTLVFVPIAREELDAIVGKRELTQRQAHCVTTDLLDELGYEQGQDEQAEYAAMVLASVASLTRFGERIVLVAEVPSHLVRPAAQTINGACQVTAVPLESMTCWFADAPDVDLTSAAAAANGLTIDQAWDLEPVSELIQGHQLLWNDVEEFRRGL